MHQDNQAENKNRIDARIAAALERIATNKQVAELGQLRLLTRIAEALERIAINLNRH
ncbi:hypothetical protein SAMN05421880_10122 [Nitrosomonas nitrosa]|uniref:Uncharacterized protein n=1 Tax=Nitrosomonas nitrosa TaxID=52442 RepID=A0A1I4KT40_9PROT|nr:hypothetical protein [Nitrosomonas nitrosa]SFL81719.1 hypothetical protein SAMN05421880_10122 [Nitrosomonas nitrosa]